MKFLPPEPFKTRVLIGAGSLVVLLVLLAMCAG